MPVLGASGAVCQTTEITVEVPQLQFFEGRRLSFSAAETALHGPVYSEDHRDSSVAVSWWSMAPVVPVVLDMPVVVQRQRQAGFGPDSAENCLEVPQVQYLAVVDVAVFSQRQSRLCREVPQTRSSTGCSSAEMRVLAAVLLHFSASVRLDVEAQGGGDAGSLTPRCSATPIRCTC